MKKSSSPTEHDLYNHEVVGSWARFREFVTAISNSDAERHAGIGLTLDDVIAWHQYSYRSTIRDHDRARAGGHDVPSPEDLAAGHDDLCIWERGRIRAVLRPYADGRPELDVVKFHPRPAPTDEPEADADAVRDADLDAPAGG